MTDRGRRIWRTPMLCALCVGAVAVSAAVASGTAPRVSLKLVGPPQRDLGQLVRMTATAKLPPGAHLVIRRLAAGRPPARISDCLRSPCRGSFRDARAEEVKFEALAVRRRAGKTTVLGRSKRIAVSWSAPARPVPTTTPQPPPPVAAPGHYEGKTAQNEAFRFDVTADGGHLTNLQTGQINETCEPRLYLSGGDLRTPGPFLIAAGGTFSIELSYASSVGGSPSSNSLRVVGRIAGGGAEGTYEVATSFTAAGVGYSCSSGVQTWSATRIS